MIIYKNIKSIKFINFYLSNFKIIYSQKNFYININILIKLENNINKIVKIYIFKITFSQSKNTKI